MEIVDLHVHSSRSDGTLSPSELVDYAMEKGLAAFALTDHDTVDGLEEALQYALSPTLKAGPTRPPAPWAKRAGLQAPAPVLPPEITPLRLSAALRALRRRTTQLAPCPKSYPE